MELALSTDIRIGYDKTMVGFPEVGLGIIPGFAGTQRMSRLIGTSKTKELIFVKELLNRMLAKFSNKFGKQN